MTPSRAILTVAVSTAALAVSAPALAGGFTASKSGDKVTIHCPGECYVLAEPVGSRIHIFDLEYKKSQLDSAADTCSWMAAPSDLERRVYTYAHADINEIKVVGSQDRNYIILGKGLNVVADVSLGQGGDVLQTHVEADADMGADNDCAWTHRGAAGSYIFLGGGDDFIGYRAWGGTVVAGSGADEVKVWPDRSSSARSVSIAADLGGGDDTLTTVKTNKVDLSIDVQGGAGDDLIDASATVYAYLRGQDGADALYGGTGDDYLSGEDGDDYVEGGPGDDQILTGYGDDIVFGDAGSDDVFDIRGVNTVEGGDGDDILKAGMDAGSSIDGGAGTDACTAYGAATVASCES